MGKRKAKLESRLVVGTKIKLGKKYCAGRGGLVAGQVITLVEGEFEYDNGLFTSSQSAPSVWCEKQKDFDSIYHLFGNDLEDFEDCEILNS